MNLAVAGGLRVMEIHGAVERVVVEATFGNLDFAVRLRDRIGPDRYALEWQLPEWLGRRYSLEPGQIATLTMANVMGLGAIRLEDDLADGEIDPREVSAARGASASLLKEALSAYATLFDRSSPIWTLIDAVLEDWRAHSGASDARSLARRGSPLAICANAVLQLAARWDQRSALEECLESTVTALVLFDDLRDWRVDVAAGRWNAFVAHALGQSIGGPGEGTSPEPSETAVHRSLLFDDPLAEYAAQIVNYIERAKSLSAELSVTGLEDHLNRIAVAMEGHLQAVRNHYRDLAHRAEALFAPAAVNPY